VQLRCVADAKPRQGVEQRLQGDALGVEQQLLVAAQGAIAAMSFESSESRKATASAPLSASLPRSELSNWPTAAVAAAYSLWSGRLA
jgi:hypothetical protein